MPKKIGLPGETGSVLGIVSTGRPVPVNGGTLTLTAVELELVKPLAGTRVATGTGSATPEVVTAMSLDVWE